MTVWAGVATMSGPTPLGEITPQMLPASMKARQSPVTMTSR